MRPWQKYDLKSVIQELNFPENLMPIIGDGWQQSMDAACDDIPEFLCPEQYTLARQACSIDAQVDEALHQTAKLITASPALTALAWHRLLSELHVKHDGVQRLASVQSTTR